MECLPDNLRRRNYYQPTNQGIEKRIAERMEEIRKIKSEKRTATHRRKSES
jgi:putative ATPase